MTEPIEQPEAPLKNCGQFQKGEGGRRKGSPNKLTRTVRDVIALAAEGLGGTEALIAWVKADTKNEFAFWTHIYPKLLPLQLRGDPAYPFQVFHRMERVIVDPPNPTDQALLPAPGARAGPIEPVIGMERIIVDPANPDR